MKLKQIALATTLGLGLLTGGTQAFAANRYDTRDNSRFDNRNDDRFDRRDDNYRRDFRETRREREVRELRERRRLEELRERERFPARSRHLNFGWR